MNKRYKNKQYMLNREKILIANGYALDSKGRLIHREVCKQAHGDFPKDWVVHHIDENKSNNSPENLIAMPRKIHTSIHLAMSENKCTFNRNQIEAMIKCYLNLDSNKNTNIIINVTVSSDQLVDKKKIYIPAASGISISSLYR